MTARPRGADPRDRGMTLAELLVTIGLLTVIGGMVLSTSILVFRTTNQVQARLDNTAQGTTAMAAVTRVLRTAIVPQLFASRPCSGCSNSALTSASSTTVTFYANLDDTTNGPSRITLSAEIDPMKPSTSRLIQVTQAPTLQADGSYTFCAPNGGSCAVATRVLTRGLVTAQSVFAYYDSSGARINSATLSASQLGAVDSVDVSLAVRSRTDNANYPARTTLTRVRLPNAQIEVDQSTATATP